MQDSEVKSYVEFVQFLLTSRPSLRGREKVQNLASFFDHIAFDGSGLKMHRNVSEI